MAFRKTIRNWALGMGIAGLCTLGAVAQDTVQGAQRSDQGGNTPVSTGSQTTATTASTGGVSSPDSEFVRKAAEGGLAEVELGQLAAEKASSPAVKQFGQRMVTDHTQANDQLKQVAAQKGITLPTSLNAKDAATKARLEKLSGPEFDRAYMQDMVRDHTKDVSEFQKEANSGKDPDVKNFASQTAPKLEDHLREAKKIAPNAHREASAMNDNSSLQ